MVDAVRIAGAGIAGLTAAVVLARGGRRVEVFEKKGRLLPSSGPHTEAIRNYRSLDALEELRSLGFGVRPFATVQRTVRHSPNATNVLRGPAYYLFLRGREANTLDRIVFREARALGVEFRFGEALEPSEADIVATGPPKDSYNVLGAGYTFSAEGSPLDLETVHALLDNDVAPGGYLVVAPGIRSHSIYSVSWTELRYEALLERTKAAFKRPWIQVVLGSSRWVEKIHGHAYFLEDPIGTAIRDGSLFVGEAGGFQDAVAGFGFRYAVLTGVLAARALLDGSDYRALLRSMFGSEFRDAFAFRQKLAGATNEDFDRMIGSLGSEITLEEYVRRREPRGF